MAKEKMEVAVATSTEVAIPTENWGVGEDLSAKDIQIPSILLMAPVSKLVKDRKAQIGEIRSSLDDSLINPKDGFSFEGIVFLQKKVFKVFNNAEKKQEHYVKTIPVVPGNENASRDFHQLCYQYFLLIVEDKKLSAIPYRLTMKSTSLNTAFSMNTYFMGLWKEAKKPSAAVVLKFGTKNETFTKGSADVWTFEKSRDSSKSELAEAYEWYRSLSTKTDIIEDTGDDITEFPTMKSVQEGLARAQEAEEIHY